VGLRAVLDAMVKRKITILHWESNPRTPIVQAVHKFNVKEKQKNGHVECQLIMGMC
jgi:hypothetical protein